MNRKQSETLKAIFEEPTRADINWRDIESLLKALGAEITQGRGSRIRVALNGVRSVFHEPHPQKETNKGAIRSLRGFLVSARIQPGS